MPSRAPLRRLACLLACLLLAGASGASPRRERAPKAASWEEVNVLAHGLLQLGHGLREHVERLGGQLRELSGRLGAHNASLAGLERSAAEQRERLARAQRLFDGRWAELDGRLRGLEGRLDGTGSAGAGNSSGNGPAAVTTTAAAAEEEQGALQNLIRRQNVRIEELIQKIKQQQFRMDKQNLQIKSLQSKVNTLIPLHGSEKDLQRPRWKVTAQRSADGQAVNHSQLAKPAGSPEASRDFWLGLEKTHRVVKAEAFQLLIELQDWEGNAQKAHFLFRLGGEETAYTLSLLGPIRGELESAMGDFPQLPFSTRDRDHDLKGDTNCAKHLSGGWWFSYCGHVNLNGRYFRSIPRQRHERKQGIFWKTWRGRYYPLRYAAMKIRPAEPDRGS
ncbi:angiopoietin-related protein 4 [Protobothrops mucrosquamatus]|uniref:angiopoietin-related protein 4 n=1 Tax=Protobothrops mucrosquamatus TaxID=103944 RepID=UPI000775DBDE|nr:angiopoietin-related protein 4 [Protobothrops mucrosquamatus]